MIRALVVLVALVGCQSPVEPEATPVAVVAPAPPPPPEPAWPVVVADATVVAVGDLLMHTNVKRSAAAANEVGEDGVSTNHDGFVALFEHVDHVIADADVAFANLETPVAPRSHRGTRSMVFNVSPALLPALRQVGFDVVSFANNHVYDQGRDGLVETMEHLEAVGLPFVGAGRTCADARAPVLLDADGIAVAFIGGTLVFNDNLNLGEEEACAFDLDEALALESAAAAREAGADLVVLSVHWGREYRTVPEAEHVALAHRLVEGGVDVILGHHPHVVQPIETVETADGRTAVIAYSLGNFISNQRYDYQLGVTPAERGNPRDGLILALDLEKVDHGPTPAGGHDVRTRVVAVRPIPVWTDNSARRIVEPEPVIRTVVLDEALDGALAMDVPPDDVDAAVARADRIALLRTRRAQVEAILGPEWLPPRADAQDPSGAHAHRVPSE